MLWTAHSNVNLWFDTFETSLVELGFGRLKMMKDREEIIGYVLFYSGQRRRIANLDEMLVSLYNTKGKQGGRPSTIFSE